MLDLQYYNNPMTLEDHEDLADLENYYEEDGDLDDYDDDYGNGLSW